ncbi:endolytic transglycosylase MltG, partial [Escherichia coli]|uniref:endolytic transglycosylase MltG n=1 Tax=Escherichia coli TaxID=562 RepID=UPI001933736A
RAAPGPYNTYLNLGLPPTPIAAASPDAIRAAVDPDPGQWIYFVKCEPTGASCFAVTPEEHDANRALAQQRNVS